MMSTQTETIGTRIRRIIPGPLKIWNKIPALQTKSDNTKVLGAAQTFRRG
jgi:hypothetical protein